MAELHVNLDPVAELRRSRSTGEPEPTAAAILAEMAGAAGVTAHIRQEQRHTEERDVRIWKSTLRIPITLILNAHEEMVKIALGIAPTRVLLVSERRDEAAPSIGLDLLLHGTMVQRAARLLREAQIKTMVFMDPELEPVKAAAKIGVDGVVFNTLRYAEAHGTAREEEERERLREAIKVATKYGLATGAFRGISYRLAPKIKTLEVQEIHAGHAIASRALYSGLTAAVAEMAALVR
ncbi:MAG: pyridoxine 5'-phosphate synthase [Acidobacteriota bacterium]